MAVDVDWGAYLNGPDKAARELGRLLGRGELALFVGAGISLEMGAPSWHLLARLMSLEAKLGITGINRKKMTGDNLADVFSKVYQAAPAAFETNVKKWLYYRWQSKPKTGNWASGTLVALGSLMSGTIRGRIDTVLSLNFDSILEMYLRLYGFIAQPITTFPCVFRRADVRIFHSHGYLPLETEDGNDATILLRKQTYLRDLGAEASPRRRMIEYVLGHRRVLALGLSGEDIYSAAIIADLAAKTTQGPLMGFWVVGPNTPLDRIKDLRESKLAAVRLASFRDLPEFLLSIARYAVTLATATPKRSKPLPASLKKNRG